MAGDGGRHGNLQRQRGWSDLPDDILDLVYRGCCSSPYDRIRFAAVCSSWRAVVSWHPKLPALPLLLPSTGNAKRDRKARAYSLEEGRALRRPLRGFPWGKQIVGSHDGGWVAASTGTRIMIVNVFSGDRVALSAKQGIIGCKCPTRSNPRLAGHHLAGQTQTSVKKVIFSKDPSSGGCVLAAITTRCKIALCRVGCCEDDGWTTRGCCTGSYQEISDIAFCNGKLYGLGHDEVFKFDIGMNSNRAPVAHCTSVVPLCGVKFMDKYIFDLRGKLAIAVKFSHKYKCCSFNYFQVYEIDVERHTWVEVTSLDDHALFIGPTRCKAAHVPAATGWRGEVERNRIYYSEQRLCPRHDEKCFKRLDLGSYTVYYGEETPEGMNSERRTIMSRGYHYRHEDDGDGCIWVLPPDF
uniref:Uncharacterized protein n=1 Tax=Avena sativa TaxID=4498 RepID=A0ACD5WNA6_AVESA